jgi:hypothetical protein
VAGQVDDQAFRILALNGNSWTTIEPQSGRFWSEYHITLVQETRILEPTSPEEHANLSRSRQTLAQHGFRVWCNLAAKKVKGGRSGGVAIVYTAHLQVEGGRQLITRRVCGLILRNSTLGRIRIGSVYLDVSGTDMEKGQQVSDMVLALQTEGIEHIWLGGAYNTSPELLSSHTAVHTRCHTIGRRIHGPDAA